MQQEIELKFQIPPERRAALRAALQRGRLTTVRLRAHYFDTADGLLAGNSIALRLRHEGARWVQTLKASGGGANHVLRLEHNAEIAAAADSMPALDLQRHAGSAAHERLCELLGDRPLQEVYRTEVQRHLRLLKSSDGALVEVALDEGLVLAGMATHRLCEIEFELKSGPIGGLFSVAADWAARHGLWLDTVTKSERGHLLARGLVHSPATKARPPVLGADPGPRQFARACVAACLGQVLPNASAIAAGSEQDAHVHQLRVGLRRLRVVLGEMAEFDCGLDPAWTPPLEALFRALGAERDRNQLNKSIRKTLLAAGAPSPLAEAPAGEPAGSLPGLVRGTEIQQVLLAVLTFASEASPASGPAFEGDPVEALGSRLDQLQRGLRRTARRYTELPVEEQHRARKRLKRLRYLAEFLAPLFGPRRVAACFEGLRLAQDVLGERNDETLALEHFQRCIANQADGAAGSWFAIGWLKSRHEASALSAASALKAAGQAKGFWRGKPKPRP